MRVQSARALLSILRFCSELFSLLSGALMGFSTRRTLIMKTVEAASIHPSIAQEPLDSCRARLINGRHSRSLPFGAGRELENSALGHLTLPATSASFGAFLPPGPEVPSERSPLAAFRRKGEAMLRVGATTFKNDSVAWARRRTSPTNGSHPPLKHIPAIRSEASTTRRQNHSRAPRRTAMPSFARHSPNSVYLRWSC